MNDAAIRIEQIRTRNDQFRQDMPHGSVRISREVGQRFSNEELRTITHLIQAYAAFRPNADIDELHDAGIIEFEGVQLGWQIEAWNGNFENAHPAMTDDTAAMRTLRVMFTDQ